MPALSIIVTSYNIENYISECLDSIANQTLWDLEIIVVDDGSSDGTTDIVRAYAERDHRIKPILMSENSIGGVSTPANLGLEAATSPYIGFADGDDYCELDMFEKLLNAAEAGDHDLAMCKYKLLDESTGELADPAEVNRWNDIDERSYELDVEAKRDFLRFIAVPWRKIYKRSMIERENIRFPVGDYFYEDNPFHWFSIISAESIAVVPEVLCYHRVARAGQTMSTADERLFKIFLHHNTIRDWLSERGIEEVYRANLFAWVMSQMEWISERTPKELRETLFNCLRDIYSQYDAADIEAALVAGKKGLRAKKLSDSLAKNNLAKFNQFLDGRTRSNNPFMDGLYHLRYSGVRHTAGLASQYVGRRVSGMGNLTGRRNASEFKLDDVMFSLAVLQAQIKQIEEKLDTLVEKQDKD